MHFALKPCATSFSGAKATPPAVEIARAIVTTRPGSTLNARSVQAYCRDRMALYKVPRIVEFWSEIPKIPNGKIDKKAVIAAPVNPERDDRR